MSCSDIAQEQIREAREHARDKRKINARAERVEMRREKERERESDASNARRSATATAAPPAHLKKTRPVRPRPHSDPINTSTRPNRLSDDGTPLTHAELLSLLEQQGVAPGGRKREAQPFQAKVREEFEFESKREKTLRPGTGQQKN